MAANELGLGFELVIHVWGRKKECVGERISGGGPPWAHEAGGAPSTLMGTWLLPLLCFQCQIF